MALGVVVFDAMLEALAAQAATASLHTSEAAPVDGADEVAGGTYARQTVTWDPATGGSLQAAGTITYDIPGGHTVRWLGLWDAAGGWLGSIKLSTAESYGNAGTYTVLLLQVNQSDVTPV